jgi:hypothetical protein
VAKDVKESRRLHDLLREQDRRGYAGIVQGERALAKLSHGVHEEHDDPYWKGTFPQPYLPGEDEPSPAPRVTP